MWKLCIISIDFRVFLALKNLEIRKNPENSYACVRHKFWSTSSMNDIITRKAEYLETLQINQKSFFFFFKINTKAVGQKFAKFLFAAEFFLWIENLDFRLCLIWQWRFWWQNYKAISNKIQSSTYPIAQQAWANTIASQMSRFWFFSPKFHLSWSEKRKIV